ncbi:MAG: GntG family PLP-dependent aldolase, partial [Pseudomonadota bacterium]
MSIDLRSDTVTLPTLAMREAMAKAIVGDDVYGEDPTVNRLQERVAELLGTEAALFVPSGTMSNQIAMKLHTRPGDEVLAGEGSHCWQYESGGAAALAGVQIRIIGREGLFTASDVEAAINPGDDHYAQTRMVWLENTHNRAGGRIWPTREVDAILELARSRRLEAHLDGARIWNAAVATGKSERDLVAGFQTVSVCLSKGLGAPVGSLLCGSRASILEAHRIRKMLGGGMRQAGILAAGAL